MRLLTTAVVVCIATATCDAQEAGHPHTLVGFLQPGTHVGVRNLGDSADIEVTIFSADEFAIAVDARRMDLDELAAKHGSVARERERQLKDFVASLESQRDALPLGTEFGEPRVVLGAAREGVLYKVLHVGKDYVLVTKPEDPTKRRAIATKSIMSIGWHEGLRFSTSVKHVDTSRSSLK